MSSQYLKNPVSHMLLIGSRMKTTAQFFALPDHIQAQVQKGRTNIALAHGYGAKK